MNQGMPYGSRGERDYSNFHEDSQDGMWWHTWFKVFHEDYFEEIMNEEPAPIDIDPEKTRIIKMFYQKEQERYKKQPEFWKPLVIEIYLESEKYRGEIDRIDQLNDQGDCLLKEYKRNKHDFDEQQLLFYACLINQLKGEFNGINFPVKITEIEVYYYQTGETIRRKLLESEITNFDNYLKSVIDEIYTPNWVKREDCDMMSSNCKFRKICKCIPETLLHSGVESQNTGK